MPLFTSLFGFPYESLLHFLPFLLPDDAGRRLAIFDNSFSALHPMVISAEASLSGFCIARMNILMIDTRGWRTGWTGSI